MFIFFSSFTFFLGGDSMTSFWHSKKIRTQKKYIFASVLSIFVNRPLIKTLVSISSFERFYKNWCRRYKNTLFWILIFLLCQKFDLLSPSQKYWSRSKSWAQSKFLKLDLNWNLFGNGSIGKFCKTQCYGRKNQLFQDLIFLPGSKFDKLS